MACTHYFYFKIMFSKTYLTIAVISNMMLFGPTGSNMSSGKVTQPILCTYKCGFFIINYGINLFILGLVLFINE